VKTWKKTELLCCSWR